jgi:hypothetical protein
MLVSIVSMFVGIGALCLLMYACAIYALPVAIGFWAGFWALNSGAGIGSIAVGLVAGALVFALGQVVFGTVRSSAVRWAVLLAFLAPALYAGYSMALQLSDIGIASPVWRHVFAVIGAIAVGASTAARLAVAAPSQQSPNHFASTFRRRPGQQMVLTAQSDR